MSPSIHTPPTLLVLAGLDPTGGAGLQADIQVSSALGIHSLPCMTINTVQTTTEVSGYESANVATLQRQLDALSQDTDIAAIKIGAAGSVRVLEVIARFVRTRWVPVVLDPVFCGGGGGFLSDEDYAEYLVRELVPYTTLVTPNRQELLKMTGLDTPVEALSHLFSCGARQVLVTGGDTIEDTQRDYVIHHLYGASESSEAKFVELSHWRSQRLTGTFHGTGCTLSTAIACKLALGLSLEKAITEAEHWVHQTLCTAYQIGHGQAIPNRLTGSVR